jgi:hypothetical protein
MRPAATVSAAQLDKLWSDLAANDAVTAYQAACALRAAPTQAVPLIAQRLKQVPHADEKKLAEAIGNLNSDRFAVRNQATKELEALDEAAESALRAALEKNPVEEGRQRLIKLLERLEGPELLRRPRALEVLEQIGNADSRRVLTTLAQGAPAARLTKEAQNALDRLGP